MDTTTRDLVWVSVHIEGELGEHKATIPGLLDGPVASSRGAAFRALVERLGTRVKSVDAAAGKVLIQR